MRELVLALLMLCFAGQAFAGPFLSCDPNTDATGYELEFQDMPLTITGDTVNGAIAYDLGTWTAGHGWFNGLARFTVSYEVVDETTNLSTSMAIRSESSAFRLKIPNTNAPKNYKAVGEI